LAVSARHAGFAPTAAAAMIGVDPVLSLEKPQHYHPQHQQQEQQDQ
jgi:hypothetical protein